jgi:hypothetical protein
MEIEKVLDNLQKMYEEEKEELKKSMMESLLQRIRFI